MSLNETTAWMALSSIRGIGPKKLWSLAEFLIREGRTAAWLMENPDELNAHMRTKVNTDEFAAAIERATETQDPHGDDTDAFKVTVIHPLHHAFPARVNAFRQKTALPALLYTRGNIDLLNAPGVGIVGARNAGDMAVELTQQIASELARAGINVVSGNARGIDSASHLAALDAGGTTTLVLSEGINRFSVKGEISEYITPENALAVSQFEPDAAWTAWFAMTRNKLVCALSSALVVIAAGPERGSDGKMSGTFDAGTSALDMGIPVFAISPTCFEDRPEGNEALIALGAVELHPDQGIGIILDSVNTAALEPHASQSQVKKSKTSAPDLFAEL